MINKSRFSGSVFAAFLAVVMLAVPVAGNAQETSSAVRGMVTDVNGNPLAGAVVTVRNDDSGLVRSTTTGATGEYSLRNLPIDEYVISASITGYGSQESTGLSVNLGRTANYDFSLAVAEQMEEIVVTGLAQSAVQVAVGPSATFDLATLQSAPAINRNITDILRADARIYVDESRGGINEIQCGGKNPRFNSLTVDGVRMNDGFGLNSNGYPTERMPFSYDALNQVSVELAPFDVQYGGFSACNINAVTKSGGNSFSGSAFYDFTNNNLRSDSLEGDPIQTNSYSEKRYGITFGGPIVQDKLSFFVAYEKLEGANLFDRGAAGSGAVNELLVTQAELDQIADIARTVYFFDPGVIPSLMPHDDEKLLVKFDWNINDKHRLAFTYNYNDGFNNTQSDSGQDEIEFSTHIYSRQSELNSYVGSLYSDWSDRFSTEARVSYLVLDALHAPITGTDFGEVRVELADVDVYFGADDSRHSNKLDYDVTSFALKGNVFLDNHYVTFGVERESLDTFNLFVQHTETELRFNNIADFAAGIADDVYYNNAPSQNPNDAAAVWGYDINTIYVQDSIDNSDRLNLVVGLRYDWYTTNDAPGENPAFTAEYGFSNSANLDGEGLIQPRFGFTFDWTDDTTLRGGVGLYTGGDPNVWMSNNFSGNNITQFGAYAGDFDLFGPGVTYDAIEPNAPPGAGPGWGVPNALYDQVGSGTGSNFEINYLDPEFKLPSEWKLALGVSHTFPGDYFFDADILVTRGQDSAMIRHGDLVQSPIVNPDGYPIYSSPLMDSFVLTNSSKGNESEIYSLSLSKNIGDSFDYRIGYSYSDARDIQPMTSSVAFSNYTNRAFFDPEEDVLATSNYNIKHRFVFTTNWRKLFANDYLLTVSLYGHANSGRPYSIAYNGTVVPYNFTPFLDFRDIVLMPGEVRNSHTGSSWTKLDLKVKMDFPGFGEDHHASVFMIIDNLTNLLNDDWGVLYQHNFPSSIRAGTSESRIGDASRYEIRFGAEYSF